MPSMDALCGDTLHSMIRLTIALLAAAVVFVAAAPSVTAEPPPEVAVTATYVPRGEGIEIVFIGGGEPDTRECFSGSTTHDGIFTCHEEGLLEAERRAFLEAEMVRIATFFAERYSITPPPVNVIVTLDICDGRAIASGAYILMSFCKSQFAEVRAEVLAHEYQHVIQYQLRRPVEDYVPYPVWFTEGEATYAAAIYASGGRLSDADRAELMRGAADAGPLSQYFHRDGHPGNFYALGALAIEWLVDHAGSGAPLRFWREIGSSDSTGTWSDAFEAAFGLTPDAFFEAFETYRIKLQAANLPHLADDSAEPIITTSGDVPDAIVAMFRTEIGLLQSFYRDRFKAGAADYTVYLADAATYEAAAAEMVGPGPSVPGWARACGRSSRQSPAYVMVFEVSERCSDPGNRAYDLHTYHYAILEPTVYSETMPYWLRSGISSYALHRYVEVSSVEILTRAVSREHALQSARGRVPLRELATLEGAIEHSDATHGLARLAVEWLAKHAGEPALFVYWREYASDTGNWHRAFETAFGLTPDQFYDRFERWRAHQ